MRPSILVAVLALAPAPLAQSAWTVSTSDPTADFVDIQSAVDAAAPGDTVILRPGSYSNFEIDGKGITIVADSDVSAIVSGIETGDAFVRIVNVPAGQTVVLRGITLFSGQVFTGTVGIKIADNNGTVWLEDCEVEMLHPFSPAIDVVHALRVESSDSVLLVDCEARGHRSSEALSVEDSTVYAYGGLYRGGAGGSIGEFPATTFDGGHGATIDGGELYAFGSSFVGGPGLGTTPLVCPPPTGGGDGARLLNGAFSRLGGSLAGGPGGVGNLCGMPDGPVGSPLLQLGGTSSSIFGVERTAAFSSPVYGGTNLVHDFTGPAGELIVCAYGLGTVPAFYAPQYVGPGLLADPLFFSVQGTVAPDGTLSTTTFVPDLGYEALTVYFQSLFVDPGTLAIRIGGAATTTVVDSSFAP